MITLSIIRQFLKSTHGTWGLELKPLNILIGANGAGKSNFLSFFKLLNFTTSGGLQQLVTQWGGASSLLYYGSKRTPQLSSTLHFTTKSGTNQYHMRLVSAAQDTLFFADEAVAYSYNRNQKRPLTSLSAGHKESMLINGNIEDERTARTARVIKNIMDRWRLYHFHDTSPEAKIKQAGYINDNRYLRSDAGNLAAFLYVLRKMEEPYYKRIVATIQQMVPFFGDFTLEPLKLNPKNIFLEWKERNSEYT